MCHAEVRVQALHEVMHNVESFKLFKDSYILFVYNNSKQTRTRSDNVNALQIHSGTKIHELSIMYFGG